MSTRVQLSYSERRRTLVQGLEALIDNAERAVDLHSLPSELAYLQRVLDARLLHLREVEAIRTRQVAAHFDRN